MIECHICELGWTTHDYEKLVYEQDNDACENFRNAVIKQSLTPMPCQKICQNLIKYHQSTGQPLSTWYHELWCIS